MSTTDDLPFIIDSGDDDSEANNEILAHFIQEVTESVMELELVILELESDPSDRNRINTAFRLFHNVKGSSAMMNYHILKDICHYSEGCLDKARSGTLTLDSAHVDLFMKACFAISQTIENIKKSKSEGSERYFLLLNELDQVHTNKSRGSSDAETDQQSQETKSQKDNKNAKIIKINRESIENLMLLVGEYITLKNRGIWLKRKHSGDREFFDFVGDLESFAQKFQRNVLKLRLSPVGPILQSMRRVIRSTAQTVGKKVELEIIGEDTLLDRSILDVISEPIMHMIRNSIDHAIEPPEVRLERNKPEVGKIILKAAYQAGEVRLSIGDDGEGIDTERIVKKAISMNMVTQAQSQSMTKSEIIQLIFQPGFSGAEKVTETSGRGVGMDVVRSVISKIGGEIDVQTELGVGTTISMKLPLSMSIIDSLSFEISGQAYAVAQVNVEEVYSLSSLEIQQSLVNLPDGEKSLNVRGTPVPVLKMKSILNHPDAQSISLIQVRYGKKRFVMEVGRILGPTSILSQPLPNVMSEYSSFSGVTTLGDGAILFLLDLEKIAQNIKSHDAVRGTNKGFNRGKAGTSTENSLMSSSEIRRLQQKIITFDAVQSFCISVQRAKNIVFLEDSSIRRIGDGHTYYCTVEGETIRLLWVEKLILNQEPLRASQYSLILFQHNNVTYGLPTSCFKGIMRMPESYDTNLSQPGVQGSTVLHDQTVLLLDPPALVDLELAKDGIEPIRKITPGMEEHKQFHVVIAEDDQFFASELTASLKANQYRVSAFEDGLAAKNSLCNPQFSESVDLIITDIEMPNMNGISLIRWLKSMKNLTKIPIIAYTAITTDEMRSKALQAGATDFISKMSFEKLLKQLDAILHGRAKSLANRFDECQANQTAQRFLVIWVGTQMYALPMQIVKEVGPIGSYAEVPQSPPWCKDVTFFRGHSIPMFNIANYLNLDCTGSDHIVVDIHGQIFSIIVDRIGEVLLESSLIAGEGYPDITKNTSRNSQLTKVVYSKNGSLVLLLDADHIQNIVTQKGEPGIMHDEREGMAS